MYQYLYNLCII